MNHCGYRRFRELRSAIVGALISLVVVAGESDAAELSDLGELNLNLRTYYFNRDKDQNNADSVAAVQAARLDYLSPYIGDLIGFDGSLFTSLKLHGRNGRGETSLLRDEANGDQSSYWKLGQILVKAKLWEETVLKAGRMVFDKPLLEDSDSRATPSARQAHTKHYFWKRRCLTLRSMSSHRTRRRERPRANSSPIGTAMARASRSMSSARIAHSISV
jgi:hypothetical protein